MTAPESVALVVHEGVELGTIKASRPADMVRLATEAADELANVIKSRKLFSRINGKDFVRCEGWTTLATMMGCLPVEVECMRQEDGGYTAVVELRRMSDGQMLTRASAECGMDEKTWASRSAYARRSMAITRATSKACRIAFSWIMVLAGYQPTPAEEIPEEEHSGAERTPRPNGDPAPSVAATVAPKGFSVDGEPIMVGAKHKSPLFGKRLAEVPDDAVSNAIYWSRTQSGYEAWILAAEHELKERLERRQKETSQPLDQTPIGIDVEERAQRDFEKKLAAAGK